MHKLHHFKNFLGGACARTPLAERLGQIIHLPSIQDYCVTNEKLGITVGTNQHFKRFKNYKYKLRSKPKKYSYRKYQLNLTI